MSPSTLVFRSQPCWQPCRLLPFIAVARFAHRMIGASALSVRTTRTDTAERTAIPLMVWVVLWLLALATRLGRRFICLTRNRTDIPTLKPLDD